MLTACDSIQSAAVHGILSYMIIFFVSLALLLAIDSTLPSLLRCLALLQQQPHNSMRSIRPCVCHECTLLIGNACCCCCCSLQQRLLAQCVQVKGGLNNMEKDKGLGMNPFDACKIIVCGAKTSSLADR
jgi:hypothetical protein